MTEDEVNEILAPVSDKINQSREEKVRRKFWGTFQKTVRHLPFAETVVAAYYCALDKETPLRARGILLAALAYFVLPFDIVPDFLFGVGFTDDVTVLVAAITAVRANIRPQHHQAARQALGVKETENA